MHSKQLKSTLISKEKLIELSVCCIDCFYFSPNIREHDPSSVFFPCQFRAAITSWKYFTSTLFFFFSIPWLTNWFNLFGIQLFAVYVFYFVSFLDFYLCLTFVSMSIPSKLRQIQELIDYHQPDHDCYHPAVQTDLRYKIIAWLVEYTTLSWILIFIFI